jgi:protein gp37
VAETKIEWTHRNGAEGYTFNPWRGCSKVDPGCANCYAETMSKRNPETLGTWGTKAQGATRVMASDAMWRRPLKWNAEAKEAGQRRIVFCASLADVFEDWPGVLRYPSKKLVMICCRCTSFIPWGEGCNCMTEEDRRRYPIVLEYREATLFDARYRLWWLVENTPDLDWLLLTKRPENIRSMLPVVGPPKNIWLGCSVSDQETANAAIPHLLKCRQLSPVLFISAEPLLGPLDLMPWLHDLDWVIVGGESGPKARLCDPHWVYSIIRQCRSPGRPVFTKQMGSNVLGMRPGAKFRDGKGGDPDEWPECFRVREWPT